MKKILLAVAALAALGASAESVTTDEAARAAANLLNVTPVTNADFGDGDMAVFVYPRSGDAKFFRPAIK